MGAASTFVLVGSSLLVSTLRRFIPKPVRISIYIIIIATFVTLADLLLAAFGLGVALVVAGAAGAAAGARLFRSVGTTVDPTAAIFDSMMTHVAGQPDPTFAKIADHLPLAVRRSLYNPSFEIGEERIEDWANTAVRQSEMIKKLYDNGIQLVPGSDDMPGFTIHRELELYALAGIPNADVLKIATLDSARVLGVEEQTGSIEVGKAADLVLLDANPLEDISAVRTGVLVMKGGAIYKPNQLYQAVGVEPF